jgi:catechol 2,3-dioxygenase-like lactoylglutathione lyase family enzyme
MPDASLLGPPVQVAYAVPDAVSAAQRWVALGAGPFYVRPHIPLVDVVHRGAPSTFDHTSAYGQWGQVMVELVQDHGSVPSVVRDSFGPGESGLHHLAFFVDDLDDTSARLEGAGHPLVMSACSASGGVRFRFHDALASHGHLFEIYPRDEHLVRFYATVAAASRGWDGTDPVRML